MVSYLLFPPGFLSLISHSSHFPKPQCFLSSYNVSYHSFPLTSWFHVSYFPNPQALLILISPTFKVSCLLFPQPSRFPVSHFPNAQGFMTLIYPTLKVSSLISPTLRVCYLLFLPNFLSIISPPLKIHISSFPARFPIT